MMDRSKKNNKLKILAGLCAVAFFAQDLAWAAPELVSAARSAAAVASPGSVMPVVRFTLPESVGFIDDHWQAPVKSEPSDAGPNERLMILIQDAHTNASGQLNLARALERILPAESIRTVYTEGAEGDVSLRFLQDRVLPGKLEGVLKEYIRKGIVKGDDYWNAVSEHDFALHGIEDMDLYRESLEVYGRTVKLRAAVRPYLDRTLRSALSLEEKIYAPAMRRLEASRQARRAGERSEADHTAFLLRAARAEGMDLSRFRNAVLFEKYRALESRLDAGRLAREQREAFDALSEADRQELQPALDASLRTPMDTAYARAFGFALREKLGPAVSKYPELKKYFSYLSKISKIHFSSVITEGRELEDALVRRLAVTPDAVTLCETVRSLEDLSDLIQFKIAPEEFERLDRMRAFSDLRPLTGWINAKLAESGRNPELAVFLEREAFEAIRSARRFYDLTYERDRVMLDRTIARMDETGEERAVLIAGGFHAPGLKRRLREAGISYVSVMPQVLHETDAARYEKLLLAQMHPGAVPSASVVRVASAGDRASGSADPLAQHSPSASSARLGAPLLGPDAARLAAALGDPSLADLARRMNRSVPAIGVSGARFAADAKQQTKPKRVLTWMPRQLEELELLAQRAEAKTAPSDTPSEERSVASERDIPFERSLEKLFKNAGAAASPAAIREAVFVLGALEPFEIETFALVLGLTGWQKDYLARHDLRALSRADSDTARHEFALEILRRLLDVRSEPGAPVTESDIRLQIGRELSRVMDLDDEPYRPLRNVLKRYVSRLPKDKFLREHTTLSGERMTVLSDIGSWYYLAMHQLGDPRARLTLNRYLDRWVVWKASSWSSTEEVSREDLIRFTRIGLEAAMSEFNLWNSNKLTTFADRRIDRYVAVQFAQFSRVPISTHRWKVFKYLERLAMAAGIEDVLDGRWTDQEIHDRIVAAAKNGSAHLSKEFNNGAVYSVQRIREIRSKVGTATTESLQVLESSLAPSDDKPYAGTYPKRWVMQFWDELSRTDGREALDPFAPWGGMHGFFEAVREVIKSRVRRIGERALFGWDIEMLMDYIETAVFKGPVAAGRQFGKQGKAVSAYMQTTIYPLMRRVFQRGAFWGDPMDLPEQQLAGQKLLALYRESLAALEQNAPRVYNVRNLLLERWIQSIYDQKPLPSWDEQMGVWGDSEIIRYIFRGNPKELSGYYARMVDLYNRNLPQQDSGARMATDRDLIGRQMNDGTEITEGLIEHIRLRMGVDDLVADQRLEDDPAGAMERAFKAIDRIRRESLAAGLDPEKLTQQQFNERFGLMPVMLAAGLTTRFSAFIPKHLAQGGMDRTVISHALNGTYRSPGVPPVVYIGLKHLGLIVKDEYLRGYDPEKHLFITEPAITAFDGDARAVRIDSKYIDPEKAARYFGRPDAAVMAFVKPLGHGDAVLQAIASVVPDSRYPYLQVAFGETASANLKTNSNASFISYLEIVGTDAEAVAGARKLKPEEKVSVKGNFFFNNDPDQLMSYTDFEQIPHAQATGAYDLVARQTGGDLEVVKAALADLPGDPERRRVRLGELRSAHPYFAISDDAVLFDQKILVDVVEEVRRWRELSDERKGWILRHFAVRESADRTSADLLIPSNTTTYRVESLKKLSAAVDRLRIRDGFDLEDASDARINVFWSVEPKDGAVKTLAWNYVRLMSDDAISQERPIRAGIAYVGERSPSSIKDPAALGKFVTTAINSKVTGLARPSDLNEADRAVVNGVRAHLVRGDTVLAKFVLTTIIMDNDGIARFRNVLRSLLAESSAQVWQSVLLDVLQDIRSKMSGTGSSKPGEGIGAHAPPQDRIVYGTIEQLTAEAVDAGWIGNNPHALVSDPRYAAAIARLRNQYADELKRLRAKDLKVMSKSSRAEYLLERLASTIDSGLKGLEWDLGAIMAFRSRFDRDRDPHVPILAVVGSVDDGGSSEANKAAINRMGYGLIPAPGDQAHSMEGLMTEDKTRRLMGEGGRLESGMDLADGLAPFVTGTVTDPEVELRDDFFNFAATLRASVRNVDRMNQQSWSASPEEERPAQIDVRGASIRNLFLIGFLREAGLLARPFPAEQGLAAVRSQGDMIQYGRAMREMAAAAGAQGFESAVSSFNPATLYAVYSGHTLLFRPSAAASGELIPVVVESAEGLSFDVMNPLHPDRRVRLEPGRRTAVAELGLVFENVFIGNEEGRWYLEIDGNRWFADSFDLDQPVLTRGDGQTKWLASDGTGREASAEGSRSETPLFTTASGGIYLVPPVIKKQTFITEFMNHTRLLRVGLLDGYGSSGHIPAAPVHQPANQSLLQKIRAAGPGDMIVIGPGSHFTSIIPHFLVDGFPEALKDAKGRGAQVIYVVNGVYDNETHRHSPESLLEAIEAAAGIPLDSMITRVAGSAPEPDESLASRSGIDMETFRSVIRSPGAAGLRSDATTASDAAKKGRALIYLTEADQAAILKRWPDLELTPMQGSLRVKRVQKRKAGEYDYRVVHEAGQVLDQVMLPAAAGVRPERLIAITGGSAVSALWAGISRELARLPSHSRDVRGPLMERIEQALGPGRFRVYPGGFASIDITPSGVDKSTAMTDLLLSRTHAVYFGDEFFSTGQKTGNDIPVVASKIRMRDKSITVFSVDQDPDQRIPEAKRDTIWIGKGPEATRRVLKDILEALHAGKSRLVVRGEGPDAAKQVELDLEALKASGALVFDVDGTILGSKQEDFGNKPEIRGLFAGLIGLDLDLAIISGNSRSEQKKRVSDALKDAAGLQNLKMYVNGGATRLDFDPSGAETTVNLSGDLTEEDVRRVVSAVQEAAHENMGLNGQELEAWKRWFQYDGNFGYRPDFEGVRFHPFWAEADWAPQVVTAEQMAEHKDAPVTVPIPFVETRDGVQMSVKLLPKEVGLRPVSGARMTVSQPAEQPALSRLRSSGGSTDQASELTLRVQPARSVPLAQSVTPVATPVSAEPVPQAAEPSEPQDFALNRLSDWFEANFGEPPVIETVFDASHKRFWATSLAYEGYELLIRMSDQDWPDIEERADPTYHVSVGQDMDGYQVALTIQLDDQGRVDAAATIKGLFILPRRREKFPWVEPLLKRWVQSLNGLTLDQANPFFGRHPVVSVAFDQNHPGFPIYRPTTYGTGEGGVRRIASPVADPETLKAPAVTAGRKTLVFYGGLGAVVPRFYMEYLKNLALQYDVVFEAVDLLPEDAARQRIEAAELPYAAYYHASDYRIDPKNPPAGIVVLTRPDSHFDLTRWANENGVPVFVEKPITLPDSVGRMREHFRQHPEEMFAIDFFFDNPSAKEALRLIDAGKIGQIRSIEGEMIEENGIEKGREWLVTPKISGGGLGMDMLVHLTALAEMVLERWGMSLRHAELDPEKIVLARYEGAPDGTETYARLEGAVSKDVAIKFGAGKGLDRSAYYLIVKGDLGEIEINLGTEHSKGFMEFRPADGGPAERIENDTSDIGYAGTTRKMVHSLHVPAEISRREREFRMEATSLSVWLMNNAQIMNGPEYQTIPLHQDPAKIEAKDVGQMSLSDREHETLEAMGALNRVLSDHFDRLRMKVGEATVEVANFLAILIDGHFVIDLEVSIASKHVTGVFVRNNIQADWRPLDAQMKKAVEAAGWTWGGLKRSRSSGQGTNSYAQIAEGIGRAYLHSAQIQGPKPLLVMVHGDPGSGKTTFIEHLTEALRMAGLSVHREDDRYVSHRIDTFKRMVETNPADIMIYEQVDRLFEGPERIDLVVEFRIDEATRLQRIRDEDGGSSMRGELHSGDLWTVPVYAQAMSRIPIYEINTTAETAEVEIREQVRIGLQASGIMAGARLADQGGRSKTPQASGSVSRELAVFAANAMRERGLGSVRMAHKMPDARLAVYGLRLNGPVLEIKEGSREPHSLTLASSSGRGIEVPSPAGDALDPTEAVRLKRSLDAQADRLAAAAPDPSHSGLALSIRVPVGTIFNESLDAVELRTAAQYLIEEILKVSGPKGADYARRTVFFMEPEALDQLAGSGRPGAPDVVRTFHSAAERHPDRFVIGRPDRERLVVNWIAGPEDRPELAIGGAAGEVNVSIGQIRPGALPSLRMAVAVPYASVVRTVGAERWKEFFEFEGAAEGLADMVEVFDGFGTAKDPHAAAALLDALQGKTPFRTNQRLKAISFNIGARLTEVMRTLMATARSA